MAGTESKTNWKKFLFETGLKEVYARCVFFNGDKHDILKIGDVFHLDCRDFIKDGNGFNFVKPSGWNPRWHWIPEAFEPWFPKAGEGFYRPGRGYGLEHAKYDWTEYDKECVPEKFYKTKEQLAEVAKAAEQLADGCVKTKDATEFYWTKFLSKCPGVKYVRCIKDATINSCDQIKPGDIYKVESICSTHVNFWYNTTKHGLGTQGWSVQDYFVPWYPLKNEPFRVEGINAAYKEVQDTDLATWTDNIPPLYLKWIPKKFWEKTESKTRPAAEIPKAPPKDTMHPVDRRWHDDRIRALRAAAMIHDPNAMRQQADPLLAAVTKEDKAGRDVRESAAREYDAARDALIAAKAKLAETEKRL